MNGFNSMVHPKFHSLIIEENIRVQFFFSFFGVKPYLYLYHLVYNDFGVLH